MCDGDTPCFWTGRVNNVKMTVLPKAISAISVKLPMTFFIQLEQKYCNICMETQKTVNRQSSLEKETGTGGIRCPDFRLYYKAVVIKTDTALVQQEEI